MTTIRKNQQSSQPAYKAPAPADYFDEVSDEHLARLKEFVADEFKDIKPETVAGPAW